jgi:hypothetical protein
MKYIYLYFSACLLLITNSINAQLNVSTSPQKKNFFIERGSGIACCSCPGVTDKCMHIIDSFPKGRGVFMIYHFGPDARPQSGQLNKDYKTKFGDSILTPVWPFYLNMMVNRIDRGVPYGSTFIFGPNNDQVTPACVTVSDETAPVNLAMASTYNSTTREITVDVKAYYTANSITPRNFLQVAITEDSIKGPQCMGSTWDYNYYHMDLFRANINGPLGAIITNTTAGSTVTGTYKYTVPAKYGTETNTASWVTPDPKHFKLVLFMSEDTTAGFNKKFGKIQNVISVPLGASSNSSGITRTNQSMEMDIMPNPSKGLFTISTNYLPDYTFSVSDILGKEIMRSGHIVSDSYTLDLSSYNKGVYLIRINSGNGETICKRIYVE